MDRLHYTGHSVLTGTAIARALLDYAQALAQEGGSATVDIPTIADDGSAGRSEILIGPASEIMSDAEESAYDEVTDETLVTFLTVEADRVRNQGINTASAKVARPEARGEAPDFEYD